MFKKENPLVEFSTPFKGLEKIPSCRPQPAKNFIPKWFENLSPTIDVIPDTRKNILRELDTVEDSIGRLKPKMKTVKTCPSFAMLFHSGWVIPAHTDMYLRWDVQGGYAWETPYEKYEIQIHDDEQMVNHLPPAANASKVFKIISPWFVKTAPGYSMYQLPMFYHYNPDWYIPFGVLETDKHPVLNHQVIMTTDKYEVVIKQGEPLAHYLPFKREEYDMNIVPWTNKWDDLVEENVVKIHGKFRGGYYKNV